MNKTALELIVEDELRKLAVEAKADAEIIAKKFRNGFGIGNTKIEVYRTSNFGAYNGYGYLDINLTFEYEDNRGGNGRSVSFTVDWEGIYRFFRSCYLRKMNLTQYDPTPLDTRIDNPDYFFRDFITKISDKG